MKKENLKYNIYSVMFGFFIMGFVDIIGIATSYVKKIFPIYAFMSLLALIIIGMATDITHTQVTLIIILVIVWCYLIGLIRKVNNGRIDA